MIFSHPFPALKTLADFGNVPKIAPNEKNKLRAAAFSFKNFPDTELSGLFI